MFKTSHLSNNPCSKYKQHSSCIITTTMFTHTVGDKQAQQCAANLFEGDTWIFAEEVTGRQPTCGTVHKV